MKSYTNLEQSEKLAEILPIESADMYYYTANGDLYKTPNVIESKDDLCVDENSIPCWSLAALLNVLPYPILCKKSDNTWGVDVWVGNKFYCTYANYKIDACYEMIIKLKELNLL